MTLSGNEALDQAFDPADDDFSASATGLNACDSGEDNVSIGSYLSPHSTLNPKPQTIRGRIRSLEVFGFSGVGLEGLIRGCKGNRTS